VNLLITFTGTWQWQFMHQSEIPNNYDGVLRFTSAFC
jgi:hypothetical protein